MGAFSIHSICFIVKKLILLYRSPFPNYLIIFLYSVRGLSDAYPYSSILKVAEIFLQTAEQTIILASRCLTVMAGRLLNSYFMRLFQYISLGHMLSPLPQDKAVLNSNIGYFLIKLNFATPPNTAAYMSYRLDFIKIDQWLAYRSIFIL